MNAFRFPVRVYYEDSDAGGVVYYANYLKFMERARTEWLRALGFEQDALMRDPGVVFAVRRVEVDYIKPARFNDALTVVVRLAERGRASLTFDQEILRDPDGELLSRGRIRIACLDAASFRPMPLPAAIQEKLTDVV